MRPTSLETALRSMPRLAAAVVALLGKRGLLPQVDAPVPAVAQPTPPDLHITGEGDSIVRIAQQYGLSTYRLMVANPHVLPTAQMAPGQRITLPSKTFGAGQAALHPAPMRPRGHGPASRRAGLMAPAGC